MTEVRDRRNGRCDVRKQRFAFMVGPGANEKEPQLVSKLRLLLTTVPGGSRNGTVAKTDLCRSPAGSEARSRSR
jgi:hypothetical protein